MKTLMRCALLAAALLSSGCATYRDGYAYQPAPAVSSGTPPRVLAGVYGVMRGTGDSRPGVDLRLRLEARGETVTIEREDLSLTTADLVPLELVSVEPEGGLVAPANGAGTWRLVFAFPPGRDVSDLDLSGLVLSWRYRVGNMTVGDSVTFEKVVETIWVSSGWYDPWWNARWWHGPWWHSPRGYWY